MNLDNNWCVYIHTCPNGKVYIGITSKKPELRWKKGKGYLQNNHFQNAILKYGWDNIKHEIIQDNLSKENACELEKYYIGLFQSNKYEFGYNRSTGGEFPAEGFHHTDESKKKISNAFIGRFAGELNPMYGIHDNHICDESGHLPKQTRERISIKAKERYKQDKNYAKKMQGFNEKKMRAVNQYDLNGNFIMQYKSRNEAHQITGICPQTIHKVCKRVLTKSGDFHKTAGGYQWRFADDCDDIAKVVYQKHKSKTGSNNPLAFKINQYELNGDYVRTWNCISDVVQELGANSSVMSAALNPKNHRNAKGYQWRKYNDYPDCLNIAPYIDRRYTRE